MVNHFNVKDAERFKHYDINLYTINNYISENVCNSFIRCIDKYAIPSSAKSVKVGSIVARYRHMMCDVNQSRCTETDNLVNALADSFSCDKSNIEPLQGVKFGVGDFHGRHVDFLEEHIEVNANSISKYGQRIITFILYLNSVDTGGYTWFPAVGLSIKPEAAKLVAWSNFCNNNRLNYSTMYEEQFVREGSKYIIVGRVREQRVH